MNESDAISKTEKDLSEESNKLEESNVNLLLEALGDGSVLQRKCYFIQFLLSSTFGAIGLLYSSVTAFLIMMAVTLFLIVYINMSNQDVPAIAYYGAAYIIIIITNALSVLVGFFTVSNYNKKRLIEHTKLMKAIIQSSCGIKSSKINFEKNDYNSTYTTLSTGARFLIIGLVLVVIFIIYQKST